MARRASLAWVRAPLSGALLAEPRLWQARVTLVQARPAHLGIAGASGRPLAKGIKKRKKINIKNRKKYQNIIKNYPHQRQSYHVGQPTSTLAIFGQIWLDGLKRQSVKKFKTH